MEWRRNRDTLTRRFITCNEDRPDPHADDGGHVGLLWYVSTCVMHVYMRLRISCLCCACELMTSPGGGLFVRHGGFRSLSLNVQGSCDVRAYVQYATPHVFAYSPGFMYALVLHTNMAVSTPHHKPSTL